MKNVVTISTLNGLYDIGCVMCAQSVPHKHSLIIIPPRDWILLNITAHFIAEGPKIKLVHFSNVTFTHLRGRWMEPSMFAGRFGLPASTPAKMLTFL